MDDRHVPRLPAGDGEPEAEIPPLSGETLLRLHNAHFHEVIARLLATSDKDERARERREFIRRAARLSPPGSVTATIKHLHARLQRFAALPLPGFLDGGMAEGALCVVLLLSSGRAPSLSTVQRALSDLRSLPGGV